MFLSDPVPRHLVEESLELAMRAPSNSNVQPWHVVFTSGAARDRLVAAMLDKARCEPPNVPELPPAFAHLRRDLGAQVYGSIGIARDDGAARRVARVTQLGVLPRTAGWRRLDAPGLRSGRQLGRAFLQTLLLALTARGLSTCVQVSIAGYPGIVRDQLGIAPEMTILCGLAVGYPDPDFPANSLRAGREGVEQHAVFLDG